MKQKDILLLVIPTVLFVFSWILFGILHGAKTSTISEAQSESILPISPSFNAAAIATLKQRTHIDPLYTISAVTAATKASAAASTAPAASAAASQAPTAVPSILATPTATLTQKPATPGGNITP